MSSFDRLIKEGNAVTLPLAQPVREAYFVQTNNLVIDHSRSWEQDLETLQKFWKWVYDKQPGLIEQFNHQKRKP